MHPSRHVFVCVLVCAVAALVVAASPTAGAQETAPPPSVEPPPPPSVEPPPPPSPVPPDGPPPASPTVLAEDDTEPDPAIPDFTSINLPTTLVLPRHKVAFRVTHRFSRPLGEGSFSDLASDFFGFDSGGQIGLELRFGLFRGTQLGVLRTSDRTIQLFAQQHLVGQDRFPVGAAAFATFEGVDNLHAERAPGFALVLSRALGSRAALYAVPAYVMNTNLVDEEGADNDTVMLGLAARVALGENYALVGEAMPRLAGHEHQDMHVAFAFERRAGGHMFQLNVQNAFGNTLAQVARGGGVIHHEHGDHGSEEGRNWYIGFNLSRKFY
jgi:hypothetical protein